MDGAKLMQQHGMAAAGPWRPRPEASALTDSAPSFHNQFTSLFNAHFPRLFRVLDRLSGEPELAADLAQEAFVRLYRRGALPDAPEAWLISVAMNLFRNEKTTRNRRRRLLTLTRGAFAHSDAAPPPDRAVESEETRRRVRSAIDRMPDRERRLLLLRAEGYHYVDIAAALELNPASVGTLLARAQRAFRALYGDDRATP